MGPFIMLALLVVPWVLVLYNYGKSKKLNKELEQFAGITDARVEAENIIKKAEAIFQDAKLKGEDAYKLKQSAIEEGRTVAYDIIAAARKSVQDALDKEAQAKAKADLYEKTAKAMKNVIDGYGNEYIMPSHSLLDDLAETYGYTQAGEDLKEIRKKLKDMIKQNLAGVCDYVDAGRDAKAVNFVVDAFNGKADSILARAKTDNFGKLKQELIDAYSLVNFNGQAFRNARITEEYFAARSEELRLACVMNGIRQKDIEEQRRIKEQMREEEKARREIERAMRDAAKQEELLQKAMEKARAQLEVASIEQRAAYEAQIAELEQKWHEAEERNKRAMSMAQQTKSGHVYIISNEGSFGKDVYKIGMTRRLEPLDRIKELGSASVPFAFDVHAMIWSEDAPALETRLHKKFILAQVNKVNYRKEYFRIPLSEIRAELEKENIEVKWTMTAEASEYHETLAIEKSIAEDAQAREAWLNRQLELESVHNSLAVNIGSEMLDENFD